MKTLLFGGAPSVGKSESIYRLAKKLIDKGYIDTYSMVPESFEDFRAILEKKNKNGQIQIAINTASDDIARLIELKNLIDDNPQINILVSSIRDDNFYPRNQFFEYSGINELIDTIVEIPLAKITRKGNVQDVASNKSRALNWYRNKIDKLSLLILTNEPFNVL